MTAKIKCLALLSCFFITCAPLQSECQTIQNSTQQNSEFSMSLEKPDFDVSHAFRRGKVGVFVDENSEYNISPDKTLDRFRLSEGLELSLVDIRLGAFNSPTFGFLQKIYPLQNELEGCKGALICQNKVATKAEGVLAATAPLFTQILKKGEELHLETSKSKQLFTISIGWKMP